MKHYLLILLAAMVLVTGVQGLSLTFQNPEDFSAQVICLGSPTACSWTHNSSGGNSYVNAGNMKVSNAEPKIMTYSAATVISGWTYTAVCFYDQAKTSMACTSTSIGDNSRVEAKIEGGKGCVYDDGELDGCTGVLAVNPSHIGYGNTISVDDIIWGSTESKYIFGMPESGYFLMKDILNPAASGFYRANQTDPTGAPILITSSQFTSTFGKGSGDNETVTLQYWPGGAYQNYYTGTSWAGPIYWNLTDFFSDSTAAPYGLYITTIHDQVPLTDPYVVSDFIPYIGSGATIQYDKNSYSVGENAVLTVIVSDSYYDTSTYAYHVVIQDIYGTEVYDEPISFTTISPYTGTATYQWSEDDDEGVYYGLIYATRLDDDVELLMDYDTADLNSVLVIEGYVFGAETELVISGALVNVTQGVTTDALTTAADGNYTTTSTFVANAPTTIFASATGYDTYQHVFTPLRAGTIQINLTLMPTNPAHSGIALGGLARSPPYNRTINNALVTIQNASAPYGNYTALTNSVGYYIKDYMPNNYWWNIWGSKTGFSNSSIYQKLVVGS